MNPTLTDTDPVTWARTRARTADHAQRRPSFARLVEVELRKATDTRAGFWLFVALGLLSLGVAVSSVLTGDKGDRTLDFVIGGVHYAIIGLAPVLGVLAVTSEWSQRTTLSTFCLVPDRGRVIRAKGAAVTVMAAAAVVMSLVVGVVVFGVGTALDQTTGDWSLPPVVIVQSLLFQWVNMLVGMAFGLLILNSPAAVVSLLALPTLLAVPGLGDSAEWYSLQTALEPLLATGVTGTQWAQILSVTAIWVALPMLAGMARLARHEIK